jgi:DNA-binding transcriptional MocR family regulator
VGLEVLSQLYRMVDFRTGRLEPSIETLCSELKRSRAAVVAALKRLKHHGFVDWIRRAEPTGNGGAGPQIKQITNAYWLCLPPCAAASVRQKLGAAPPPDCELARQENDRAELESMLAQLGLGDQGAILAEDPELAELLRSLGDAVSRDSASSLSGQNPA